MKVLIACEYSGTVRDAFIEAGHDAMSCDILPTDKPGPHYQGDIFDVLYDDWDLVIGFPPCTHLAASGAPSWKIKQADGRQQKAFEFVLKIYESNKVVCIENPSGWMNTNWRRPDQIIHPYHFGEPYMKRTCLWLKGGLQKLEHTEIVEPRYHWASNSTRGGIRKDGTRKKSVLPIRKAWDTGHERSKSFKGIADAMAAQWG